MRFNILGIWYSQWANYNGAEIKMQFITFFFQYIFFNWDYELFMFII